MTDHKTDENINDVLGQVAYQMKDALDTMYAALQRVAPADARDLDAELDENAAMLTRNFFRLRRLSANLEEAANLDAPALSMMKNDDIIGLCASITERAQGGVEHCGCLTRTGRGTGVKPTAPLDRAPNRINEVFLTGADGREGKAQCA